MWNRQGHLNKAFGAKLLLKSLTIPLMILILKECHLLYENMQVKIVKRDFEGAMVVGGGQRGCLPT